MLLGIIRQVSLEHLAIGRQLRVCHLVDTKNDMCTKLNAQKTTIDLDDIKHLYLCLDRDAPGDPHWP